MTAYERRRPGRPRHINKGGRGDRTPREEVLDVAARLFTEQGYANTSTREIAEAVGMRQASLYYHFPDKADMLAEVLNKTIRPTLENVTVVEELADDDRAAALYLLVLLDVQTLVNAPHNSGLLGMLPDVAKEIPDFATTHAELADEYGRLGAAVASRPVRDGAGWKQLGRMLLQNVEMVIVMRADKTYNGGSGDVLAATCLRMCGATEDTIDRAKLQAHALLAEIEQEQE